MIVLLFCFQSSLSFVERVVYFLFFFIVFGGVKVIGVMFGFIEFCMFRKGGMLFGRCDNEDLFDYIINLIVFLVVLFFGRYVCFMENYFECVLVIVVDKFDGVCQVQVNVFIDMVVW